jgi:hypothetical protein
MDYYEIDEISLDGLLKFGVYLNEEFGKQEWYFLKTKKNLQNFYA